MVTVLLKEDSMDNLKAVNSGVNLEALLKAVNGVVNLKVDNNGASQEALPKEDNGAHKEVPLKEDNTDNLKVANSGDNKEVLLKAVNGAHKEEPRQEANGELSQEPQDLVNQASQELHKVGSGVLSLEPHKEDNTDNLKVANPSGVLANGKRYSSNSCLMFL